MKSEKYLLAKCIAIPLIVGGVAAFLSRGGMAIFATLKQPPLSPPGWLFPVVWTILYVLMGIASYLVWTSVAEDNVIADAIVLYCYQLTVNFLWPIFFFDFGWYLFSFFWLLLLCGMVYLTVRTFSNISKPASYILIPYLVWVIFAGYLNLGVWLLN